MTASIKRLSICLIQSSLRNNDSPSPCSLPLLLHPLPRGRRKNVGLVAKNEKSFDRFVSGVETVATTGFAYKSYKANQAAAVEKAGIEAKTAVTSQAIDKGAEVLPVSISSP